ncbi:TonB-dependent receptor domain-containing protein [Pontibacter silvestris]|uniref:TonB-dependent receptor domain-containing protein n=1 Tax=Pontibacter silvestris TaxID=2305183 RepID=A0ABW4X1N0_9BACT|nr:TonB-dependent receptor [Pontibacter silvestris]MCC9136097.1 TonB-dependent receptor [Pontibacter silvestris]
MNKLKVVPKWLFLLIALVSFGKAYAQGVAVYGTVQSAQDKTVLPGASVVLTNNANALQKGVATDMEGIFRFENVAPGQYKVEVNFLGFKTLSQEVKVQDGALNLGTLTLEESSTTIKEVQVIGRVPLGEQKGDTTQYNAGAFKTAPDASAEDLVQKMPGITIQDGAIQAQGQDVKQVLVDGKRFFGDDASTALRNLPADVIENIQIFDKKSDQAELTGVDDGNRDKTINIVTKADRRVGQFGKMSAGYGTDDRYMIGASVNFFNGDSRFTVTGLTNNINMLDFSVGETPGGGMRGRRPPSGGGTTTGLISTNTLGLNYSDTWGKKIEVSGNYNFTQRQIENNQLRRQNYILPTDSGQVYTENQYSNTTTTDHKFNFRFDYNINDNNRLLITPSFTLSDNDAVTAVTGNTINNNGAINETENNTSSDKSSYTFNNNIYFSHKFGKAGRTISTSLTTGLSGTDGESSLLSNTIYYRGNRDADNRNQYTLLDRSGYTWSGDVSYTEPVGQHGQLQLQYNIGNQLNDSDKKTYNYSEQSQSYSLLDTTLSNVFNSEYLTQRTGLGYQYSFEKLRLRADAKYQSAELQSDQTFPSDMDLKRTFTNVLPSVQANYNFSKTRSFDFNYTTSTNAPSVDQLQGVIDNTNPLQLSSGNASLKQSYQHSFRTGYRNFDMETNRVFFIGFFGNITQDYIANSITRATNGDVTLSSGVVLEEGQQLTQSVNLDGYWNVRSFFHYGKPVNFISSNIGVHGNIGYTRTPGLNNGELNYTSSPNFGLGITLSSNISEKIDFTVSTNSTYNIVKYSLQPEQNSNYFLQNTSLKYNWIFWKGLVYRTELNHQLNSGLSAGYDNSYLLWNMSVSKKLFKNEQGEISLSVNDLLKQNVSVQRNLSAQYVEDVQASALQRYFMLTFTYNLRNFSSGSAPATPGKNFPGPPPGGGTPPPPNG